MQKLKSQFDYSKFKDECQRILYLNDDYFLQKESIQGLRALGHEVAIVPVLRDKPSQMLENLLKTALLFKPDCVVTINHAGFDGEGKIAALLADLEIPVISWFLDDFRFIIRKGAVHALGNTAVFTIESSHVPLLRKAGFDHVFYLPSAAPRLKPVGPDLSAGDFTYLNESTVFVGSAFRRTAANYRMPRFDDLIRELGHFVDFTDGSTNLIAQIREYQGHLFRSQADFYRYAAYVMCYAIQVYRESILREVTGDRLHIFGGEDWRDFAGEAVLHGAVRPDVELPQIYQEACINLNITSRQLPTGVNLRVFDVPFNGGFLITDWKEALEDLFDVENELVTYRGTVELKEKLDYYHQHPSERDKVVARAAARVEAQHLIVHRMQEMVEKGKAVFA